MQKGTVSPQSLGTVVFPACAGVSWGPYLDFPFKARKLEGDWESILDEQKIMSLQEWEGTQVSAASTISSRKQKAKAFNLEN